MAGFSVRRGIADSDSLFIETRRMVATGEAELNFPRNKVDMTLTPLSKSRSIQIPSSIRVRGDMDDPRIIASPVAAVADATTEALTLIPRIIGKMFGRNKKNRERQPCVAIPGN